MLRAITESFDCSNRRYLYLGSLMRSFSTSMISVFIPLHLLSLGYSIKNIAAFFIFQYICSLIYTLIGMKVVSRIGFERAYLYSLLPCTIYFFLIATLDSHSIPLLALPLLGQFSVFYWIWQHVSLAKHTKDGARNSQTAMLHTLYALSGMLGPLVGGIIMKYFGIFPLVICVFISMMFSAFIMSRMDNYFEDFSYKSFLKDAQKLQLKQYIGFASRGINGRFHSLVWPIVSFTLFLNDYVLLGASVAAYSLTAIFAGHFASSMFDKNEKLGLNLGSISLSLIWIGRIFIVSPIGVIISNLFEGIFEKLTGVSFNAMSYSYAQKMSLMNYTLARETTIHMGAIFISIMLYLTSDWISLAPLAALTSLLYLFF